MYPHRNSDSECRARWSLCFCFWFLLLYQRWCWQFVWEVTHVMQRAPSLRGHLRNWSFCYLNAGFLTLLVWSLRPFSISTYSDWLNTDRLGSSLGSVVVVLFGVFLVAVSFVARFQKRLVLIFVNEALSWLKCRHWPANQCSLTKSQFSTCSDSLELGLAGTTLVPGTMN